MLHRLMWKGVWKIGILPQKYSVLGISVIKNILGIQNIPEIQRIQKIGIFEKLNGKLPQKS